MSSPGRSTAVLAQDCPDWELVVVDNGCTDDTQELLRSYQDERIKVVRLEKNLGCTGGRNACLDHISREWFTFLDSDDELVPNALSTLLAVPATIDPAIDAITCNSIDSETGEFTGVGLGGGSVARPAHDHVELRRRVLGHHQEQPACRASLQREGPEGRAAVVQARPSRQAVLHPPGPLHLQHRARRQRERPAAGRPVVLLSRIRGAVRRGDRVHRGAGGVGAAQVLVLPLPGVLHLPGELRSRSTPRRR